MDGTERLFERMVHEHQDRVFALGLALTGNRHDAEEVAQDTFLRAYRALVTCEPDQAIGPEDGALLKMEMDALAVRVAELPARYREAVVLRHVQELSYQEAADALRQPVGTVKANVHRGLKLLRGDDDHDDSDD